jgi:hypothetical protein
MRMTVLGSRSSDEGTEWTGPGKHIKAQAS